MRQQHRLGELPKQVDEFLAAGRRSPSTGSVPGWMPLLLSGFLAIAAPIPVQAEPIAGEETLAQQYSDTLPLPPIPFGEQELPNDPSYFPPIDVPAPPVTLPNPVTFKRYLVYIPGDNPVRLAQIRLIEPEAFITNYEGRRVIQAGVFENQNNAQRRAREMEVRVGIRAAIATLTEKPFTDPSFTPPQAPNFPSNFSTYNNPTRGYFVIIPGNRLEFSRITNQLIEAGVNQQDISVREYPFGSHLAIGPFPDRKTAEQESGYIQHFGMDARVYYSE